VKAARNALRIERGEVEFATALASIGYCQALDGHASSMQVVANA
jgi:hypothetical protein